MMPTPWLNALIRVFVIDPLVSAFVLRTTRVLPAREPFVLTLAAMLVFVSLSFNWLLRLEGFTPLLGMLRSTSDVFAISAVVDRIVHLVSIEYGCDFIVYF